MNIVEKVKNSGVVGAGGAGFPTHIKIGTGVDTLLANGAECEPLLYSDQYVMKKQASEIVGGLLAVMEATGAKQAFICVKEKYPEIISGFEKLIVGMKNIKIFPLGNFYPSGDEHVLVKDATGRIVPEGGLPLNVGVLVQNVTTLSQVARALKGEAVTERAVTVGGEIKKPGVYLVPIGTEVSEVIKKCGGSKISDYSVLLNGPMMGRLIDPEKEVITKTSAGLIVLPKDHPFVTRISRPLKSDIMFSKAACEQCRYCTDFCPRYLLGHSLEPHKIMRVINEDREPEAETVTRSFLCCECGVCDLFACPMFLSPRRFFKEFKSSLAKRKIKNPHNKKPEKEDVYRSYRRVPMERLTRMLSLSMYDGEPGFFGDLKKIDRVKIPLSMHVGAPAKAAVKKGDKVKKGQVIGEIPHGKLSARVHASISGMVTEVNGYIGIEK